MQPMRSIALIIAALTGSALHSAVLWEGFELGSTQWATDESKAKFEGRIARDVASQGAFAYGGRVEAPGGEEAGFFLQPQADFSKISSLSFDIYVGTKETWSGKVIIQTGNAWAWHESPGFSLKPGWNRNLSVNFGPGGVALKDADLLQKLQIMLTPSGPSQGALYLDHVRLEGSGAAALAPIVLPALREFLANDFETRDSGWKAVYGGAVKVEPDLDNYSMGQKGLRLQTMSKNAEENAIFGTEKDFDLSGVQAFIFDVYNPGGHATLALAASYGPDWKHSELPAAKIKPGWNYNLTFDIRGKNFKSEASGWKNNMAFPDLKAVRRVSLAYTSGEIGAGGIVIDRMRIKAQKLSDVEPFKPLADAQGLRTNWADGPGLLSPKSDWSDARAVSSSRVWLSSGSSASARLGLNAAGSGSSATYVVTQPIDLRGVRAMELDAYNPTDHPMDLSMAFQVGEGQIWYETRQAKLAPGWNEGVSLALDGPVFKSATSQWAYGAVLPGRDEASIKSSYLQIQSGAPGPGELYVNKLQMVRRPDLAAVGIPLIFQGDYQAYAVMDDASYTLWDSGTGEGSFETNMAAWGGKNGGGFGLSLATLSKENFSQGQGSIRVDFRGPSNDSLSPSPGAMADGKAALVFDTATVSGSQIPDLSQATRIRADIFNPGRPMGFSIAFTSGVANEWWESASLALTHGWNRDVTIELDSVNWKPAASANSSVPVGASQQFTRFPALLRGAGMLNAMYFNFHKVQAGSVYVDNIRFGKLGGSSDMGAKLKLGGRLFMGRHLEAEFSGALGKSQDGSVYALPAAARMSARLAGHELGLGFGAALKPFDDELKIFNNGASINMRYGQEEKAVSQGQAYLEYRGVWLGGLQTQAFGALPWYQGLYSPGDESMAGLRAKAPLAGFGSLGATWVSHRVGYTPGASYISDPAEQSVQIGELDADLSLPGGLGLGGAYAQSVYARDKTLWILRDSQGLPQTMNVVMADDRSAYKARAAWSYGPLSINAAYSRVGLGFYTQLSSDVFNARKIESKAALKLDSFNAIASVANGSGFMAPLAKGLALSFEYNTHEKSDDTYIGRTPSLRLENANDAAYGFVLKAANQFEEKNDALAVTRTDNLTLTGLLRGVFMGSSRWALGLQQYQTTSNALAKIQQTLGAELRLVLPYHLALSGAYGYFGFVSGSPSEGNVHARLEYNPVAGFSAALAYGQRPFYDDELGRNWVTQDSRMSLNIKGSF